MGPMMMSLVQYILLVCSVWQWSVVSSSKPNYDVQELSVEPDFRAILLKWRYPNQNDLLGFRIRYCEMTNWLSKNRCKERIAKLNSSSSEKFSVVNEEPIVQLVGTGNQSYAAAINNLRMLTNYSVSIKADFGQSLNNFDQFNNPQNVAIQVETKSFAAKTSLCLANSSTVEVFTGPYFSGKISIEGSTNPLCAIYGNQSSDQRMYTFKINHDICRSKVINNSRIEAMVIVHENKEILTHNSRRYLVVCTFVPETYTLTASATVPKHLLKMLFERMREKQQHNSTSQTQSNETYRISPTTINKSKIGNFSKTELKFNEAAKLANLRDSRMLTEDTMAKSFRHKDDSNQVNTIDGKDGPKLKESNNLTNNKLVIGASAILICGALCLYVTTVKCNHYSTTCTLNDRLKVNAGCQLTNGKLMLDSDVQNISICQDKIVLLNVASK